MAGVKVPGGSNSSAAGCAGSNFAPPSPPAPVMVRPAPPPPSAPVMVRPAPPPDARGAREAVPRAAGDPAVPPAVELAPVRAEPVLGVVEEAPVREDAPRFAEESPLLVPGWAEVVGRCALAGMLVPVGLFVVGCGLGLVGV